VPSFFAVLHDIFNDVLNDVGDQVVGGVADAPPL
jgi:hypothetical protein